MRSALIYIVLIGAIFIYTTSGVFSKLASQQNFASLLYIAFLCGSVAVLGIYAVLWQQIIKRMPVGDAYLFKGTGGIAYTQKVDKTDELSKFAEQFLHRNSFFLVFI